MKNQSPKPNTKDADKPELPADGCSTFINVPRGFAGCPECGGHISAEMDGDEIFLHCENEPPVDSDERDFHRWNQDDWQPVINRVRTLFE